MLRINVLVAATSPDIKAEGIAVAVAGRPDMALVAGRVVAVMEADTVLESLPPFEPCALILVGRYDTAEELAERWLIERADLVVLHVDLIDDVVRIALRDIGLTSLLTELRSLVDRAGSVPHEGVVHFQLRSTSPASETRLRLIADEVLPKRPLLQAAIHWIHKLLRDAVVDLAGGNGDLPGLTVTPATVAATLDALASPGCEHTRREITETDALLTQALADADVKTEPLATAVHSLGLTPLEFRIIVLALAPELDPRYQRCFGLLLDDLGRRVGTLGLYATLLGEAPCVRRELGYTGNLARWRVFDGHAGGLPPADDSLRLDAFISGWLLGESSALDHDPRVRRAMQLTPWPGASLLDEQQHCALASSLISRLQSANEVQWIVLAGDDAARWRALLELGASNLHATPIRVDTKRLTGLDVSEIEESSLRFGRMARLTGRPLIIDATASVASAPEDDSLRLFLETLGSTDGQAALIANNDASIVRLLGSMPYELLEPSTVKASARTSAVSAAASGADAALSEAMAEAIANQYPLEIDRLEHAMRLARSRPLIDQDGAPRHERFITACKEVAAENLSGLAQRIEPVFTLDDMALPADRKQQLLEIVDSIRLAPTVLDGWQFRKHLPYGCGVTALFHGPSGTGKTMAAMSVARSLDVQLLRLDFSRVVSKYIGDTEKNIDRVFNDAQKSGCAILIDEADALLGKRSEVKDAHDRYANIEVAYLLPRMETYEGLAILTTNLRQNLDAAFLRRLRFIIDFPRPDAGAREEIWRRCLPEKSHKLDDAAFRLLARKIELTGGHIRQITLRAAFVAAAAGKLIGFEHIVYATNAEFAKLGRPAVALEVPADRKAA